jgi:flagellar basal-body rod modification protein FlgD
MSVNQINSNTPQKNDPRAVELKKAQNMFFKLLTTQLQCQDIENTVDMNQMTQQIFQMNELQTLISIDHKLDEMNQSLKSNESAGMAGNMVGKYAATKTDKIAVNNENAVVPVSYIIDGNAPADVQIKVLDDKGHMIYETILTDIMANEMQNFELNFRDQNGNLSVPAGIYKVQVLANNKKDKRALTSQVYNTNKIQQAMNNGEFIMSNNQQIKLADIAAIQITPLPLTNNPYKTKEDKMNIQDLMAMQMTTKI